MLIFLLNAKHISSLFPTMIPMNSLKVYDLQQQPYRINKLGIQDLIYYSEVRFCAAMRAIASTTDQDKLRWMKGALQQETVRA